ncbi:enoyl-[acyl-carrier protein] reductase II [Ruminococcus sp. YE71]|uniref:enoyl-[acyl-carrier-protein] reductase FabK n=1 Tax=unclassified Ruminococcus TaxID=2608920 RepID=UPI00088887F3|nr:MULTISPECIES: enoyl-[acyl-carrier-protein] reductase FabK [unclassified Ruminococcus]SDA17192.1 enoyl-[acyl-carrier protein] reductase II [Ruminococcus sp. YE78]SFW26442.1 enoyl-[acyl-carrier protein] reductase II [Ruminococcus sp. YE71]
MTTTKTRITDLLGIKYPIFQGGMAWIAESKLAAAVSNAGGLGIIAGGSAPIDYLRDQIRAAKSLTDKPFGVNIMLMSPNADDLAQLVIDEGVAVVTTGAGNPGKFMAAWKDAGVKVVPVVPSVALAKRMERSGADAVIAEGTESGGHIGENTTMCLVPQVVDALEIPVLAAGGIADGRGIAASFMLGAEGVQVGTRFLASEECVIHPTYKELVVKAKDTDSIVTGRYTGHPCRNVRTKFSKKLASGETNGSITPDEFEELTLGSLRKAVQDGNLEEGSFLCGAIAGMITDVKPCKDIIEEMFAQAEALLNK